MNYKRAVVQQSATVCCLQPILSCGSSRAHVISCPRSHDHSGHGAVFEALGCSDGVLSGTGRPHFSQGTFLVSHDFLVLSHGFLLFSATDNGFHEEIKLLTGCSQTSTSTHARAVAPRRGPRASVSLLSSEWPTSGRWRCSCHPWPAVGTTAVVLLRRAKGALSPLAV